MGQQWMELQQWIFPQRFFRENLKLGEAARKDATTTSCGRCSSAPARRDGQADVRRRRAGMAGGGAVPHAGLRCDAREA